MMVTPQQQAGIAANGFLYGLAELRHAVESLADGELRDAWVGAVVDIQAAFDQAAAVHRELTGREMTPPAVRRPPFIP